MSSKIQRALISVFDKSHLEPLVQILKDYNIEIVSTGGTYQAIIAMGYPSTEVSHYTHFPEILNGRVKTLHPKIHGGILAQRKNAQHEKTLHDHNIPTIDLVIVNLYPFEATVQRNTSYEEALENIDIGGPCMIRSAAKNHAFVGVVVDPNEYTSLIHEMRLHKGGLSLSYQQTLAQKAFLYTAHYDACIAQWLTEQLSLPAQNKADPFPQRYILSGQKKFNVRYGENPHQKAAFYTFPCKKPNIAHAQHIQGKPLSYNNIHDADAAFHAISEFFEHPAVVIVKHTNPCGVALGETLHEAYGKALASDRQSAFGGILAINQPLDAHFAHEVSQIFLEVLIAPAITEEAKKILEKKENLRILITGSMPHLQQPQTMLKTVTGGFLVQEVDHFNISPAHLHSVTKRHPTEEEIRDLMFAFRVCKHVKSNAIVYAHNQATVGIGAGQMSRVDSANIARTKYHTAFPDLPKHCVVASDAFFPFSDGLFACIAAGATAVIQPGGSKKDWEIIDVANEHNLAMIFTGHRSFKH